MKALRRLGTWAGAGLACVVAAGIGLALRSDRGGFGGWLATVGLYGGGLCVLVILGFALRRRPAQGLLLVISLLLAALLGELVLRAAWPPYWPKFEYVGSRRFHHLAKPSQRMFAGVAEGEPVIVITNADGLRTRYDRESFQRHRHRIAVLGDSFAFGFRVTQEAAAPQVLEGILREGAPEGAVAVLNAGLLSYSPFLGRRLFEGLISAYHPTVVLYLLDCSDIGDDAIYAGELREGPEGSHFDVPEYRYRGALLELLRLGGVTAALRRPFDALRAGRSPARRRSDDYDVALVVDGEPQESRYFIFKHPLDKTRGYFESTYANIRGLAESVRAAGAHFVLVVTPRFQHWSQRECSGNWEAKYYSGTEPWQDEIFRFFAEKAAAGDVAIVDLLPRFRATTRFPLVFEGDPHWNRAGHRFVAGAIAEILRTGGYLE